LGTPFGFEVMEEVAGVLSRGLPVQEAGIFQDTQVWELAPRTVQNMSDILSLRPMTVLQPASTTPEPTKSFWARYRA
jgi:hypothetical protein